MKNTKGWGPWALFLIFALTLAACGPAPVPTAPQDSPTAPLPTLAVGEKFYFWDTETITNDPIIRAFIAQSSYTGMTPEELLAYYVSHNSGSASIEWTTEPPTGLKTDGLVYSPTWDIVRMSQGGTYTSFPLEGVVASGLFLTADITAGIYVTTPAYAEKMDRLAALQPVPAGAVIYYPHLVMSTAAISIKSGNSSSTGGEATWSLHIGASFCVVNMSFTAQNKKNASMRTPHSSCDKNNIEEDLTTFKELLKLIGIDEDTAQTAVNVLRDSIKAQMHW